MNINKTELGVIVKDQAAKLIPLIERALEDSAKHGRSSRVVMTLNIKHDKKNPNQINLTAIAKTKEPKGDKIDLSGTTDEELLMSFVVSEEDGQQTIDD
jgi:hypothetical protein